MQAGQLPNDKQVSCFQAALGRNPTPPGCSPGAVEMGPPAWYLAAGCLYQPVRNVVTSAPRMRCKWFCSRGLFTGSGVAGAGRKAVAGQRRKLSGMRRTVPGAEAIIALRGREASSHREEIWQRPRNQTATA